MRVIGCMSNVFARLETTLVLHIGASSFSWLRKYFDIPNLCLLSLKRRHSLIYSLAASPSSQQDDHFKALWGILSKRELDDLRAALANLDVRIIEVSPVHV